MTSADTVEIGSGEEVDVSVRSPQPEVARRKLRRSWSLTSLGKLEAGLSALSPAMVAMERQQRPQLRTRATTRTTRMRTRHTNSAVSILVVIGGHLTLVICASAQSYETR